MELLEERKIKGCALIGIFHNMDQGKNLSTNTAKKLFDRELFVHE
jgi:alpha-D-ribose 1-methylphosphonate 5-triphosphate synthase subunit PhnL